VAEQVGGLGLLCALLCVALLSLVPPPSAQDVARRSVRTTMTMQQQGGMVREVAPGIAGLLLTCAHASAAISPEPG
jgi:hypothetical protein